MNLNIPAQNPHCNPQSRELLCIILPQIHHGPLGLELVYTQKVILLTAEEQNLWHENTQKYGQ